jgi:type II restriction/modification system DNA methylase subunit YeeA
MTTDNTSSTTPVPNFYRASAADFKMITGSPIAYWTSEKVRAAFQKFPTLSKVAKPRQGLATSDNNRFLKQWFEPSIGSIGFDCKSRSEALDSKRRWFPCQKGGAFRKWYGNNDFVINWENDGEELLAFATKLYKSPTRTIKNIPFYFQEGITYSDLTTGKFGARFLGIGYIFDTTGPSIFDEHNYGIIKLLAYINSKVFQVLLDTICTGLHYNNGVLSGLPVHFPNNHASVLSNNVDILIDISREDWDSYETSWDFATLPLLQPEFHQPTLHETYSKLRTHWKEMTLEIQRMEEENNRIYIEAYGLQDELTPETPLSEITLTCNPHYRYKGKKTEEELEALLLADTIKEFISYAVGCMFGRYSLDKPGLILANQGEDNQDYLGQVPEPSFMLDVDNIIPILEDEYFEDDIVTRFKEFLKVMFGEDTLSENLDFIADALGSNGKKSSEAVIRDYFLKSFYKDHVKLYKKRPIYWLFSSGKGRAFNALIYMHRYNNETLAMMRTDYLLVLEGNLDAKREMIKSDIGKDAQEKARLGKMIDEIMEYDELLKNKADEYIEIDLDDGVKVNYGKFEGLVEKI